MRATIVAAALLLTACGSDPGGPQEGPALGYWTPSASFGWTCGRPGTSVEGTAPAPFAAAPIDVLIRGGGVIVWNLPGGAVEHSGAAAGLCIEVPAGSDHGHPREAYRSCIARDGMGNELPDQAGAGPIEWDVGTPDECWCTAYLEYAGPE